MKKENPNGVKYQTGLIYIGWHVKMAFKKSIAKSGSKHTSDFTGLKDY